MHTCLSQKHETDRCLHGSVSSDRRSPRPGLLLCREIGQRPVCSETGARLHFVDDRLDTLTAVQQQKDLSKWQLYLADW